MVSPKAHVNIRLDADVPAAFKATGEVTSMKPELYHEVTLPRDIVEEGLRTGDVATLVDYVPHPSSGEEGAVLDFSMPRASRSL